MSHNSVHLYAEQVRSDILCINLRPQAHIVKIVLRLVIRVTYVKQNAIQPANLEFNAEGTPVSRDFDDVYFSNDNGLEETRYVFLGGNRLPERFPSHPRPLMIIAESGFGTGLNFLTLWQAFDVFVRDNPDVTLQRLHFISFEKYPLKAEDLRLAHQRWPELAPWAQQLQAQWPSAFGGCHRLLLDGGRVTLDLWFGDINELTRELDDSLNQQVDAWFLDGFAPAKNPDMWTQDLFSAMARLARPGGTLATFTSAGFVRRGLQEAGFTMRKSKGFGRKREMLTGEMAQTLSFPARAPWFARSSSDAREAAIIGGGIASALLSLALLRRGWQVTLYCADEAPAQGASGNRQGALYPLLSQHDPALARFFPAAFTFARRMYDALPVMFDHQWCGVTQLGWDEKSTHKIAQMLALNLPPDIACAVTAEQVAGLTGVDTGSPIRPAAGCARSSSPPSCWRWRPRADCTCTMVIPSKRSARRAMAGCSISSAIIRRWFWRTATASLVLRKPPNCRSTRLAARSAIFPPPRGLPPCARCCATTAT